MRTVAECLIFASDDGVPGRWLSAGAIATVVGPDEQHREGQGEAQHRQEDERQLVDWEDQVRVQLVVLGAGHDEDQGDEKRAAHQEEAAEDVSAQEVLPAVPESVDLFLVGDGGVLDERHLGVAERERRVPVETGGNEHRPQSVGCCSEKPLVALENWPSHVEVRESPISLPRVPNKIT